MTTVAIKDLTSRDTYEVDAATLCVVVRAHQIENTRAIQAPLSGDGAVEAASREGQVCSLMTVSEWVSRHADRAAYIPDPTSEGEEPGTVTWWRSSLPEHEDMHSVRPLKGPGI
jgi:hypothetical protein